MVGADDGSGGRILSIQQVRVSARHCAWALLWSVCASADAGPGHCSGLLSAPVLTPGLGTALVCSCQRRRRAWALLWSVVCASADAGPGHCSGLSMPVPILYLGTALVCPRQCRYCT